MHFNFGSRWSGQLHAVDTPYPLGGPRDLAHSLVTIDLAAQYHLYKLQSINVVLIWQICLHLGNSWSSFSVIDGRKLFSHF